MSSSFWLGNPDQSLLQNQTPLAGLNDPFFTPIPASTTAKFQLTGTSKPVLRDRQQERTGEKEEKSDDMFARRKRDSYLHTPNGIDLTPYSTRGRRAPSTKTETPKPSSSHLSDSIPGAFKVPLSRSPGLHSTPTLSEFNIQLPLHEIKNQFKPLVSEGPIRDTQSRDAERIALDVDSDKRHEVEVHKTRTLYRHLAHRGSMSSPQRRGLSLQLPQMCHSQSTGKAGPTYHHFVNHPRGSPARPLNA
ncbi:hypothetical protein SISSUDRAFT_1057355 [Sistotremastrum suecicum HHB10207 ss-3]|nr:hypothetical protein SISSUDRAFT_1057355 [Sistotremastrum suecicum HHB10207 ss-3]